MEKSSFTQEAEKTRNVQEMKNEMRDPEPPVLTDLEKTEAPISRARRRRRTPPTVVHRPITRSLTRAARMAAHPLSFNFSESSLAARTLFPSRTQPSLNQKHQLEHHRQETHSPTPLHQEHHVELSPYEVFSKQQHQAEFVQSVLHRGAPHGQQVPHQPSKSQQIPKSSTNHSPNLHPVGSNPVRTSLHNSCHTHDPSQKDAKTPHNQVVSHKRTSEVANEQVAKQMRIAHRKRAKRNQESLVQQAPLQPDHVHDVQNAPSHASQVQKASRSASPRRCMLTDASTSIQQAPCPESGLPSSTPNGVPFVQHFTPKIQQASFSVSPVTQASSPVQPMLHHMHTSMQQVPYHASPMQTDLLNVPLAQPRQGVPLHAQQPQHRVADRNQYSDETFYGETSSAASLIPELSRSPLHMQKASELVKVQTPQQKFPQRLKHVITTPTPPHGSPCMQGPLQPSSQAAFTYPKMTGPLFSTTPDTMRSSNKLACQYHAQKDSSAFESLSPKQQPPHAASLTSTFMLPPPPPPPPSPSHSSSTSPLSHRHSDRGAVGGACKSPQSNNQRRNSGSSVSVLPSVSQSTSVPSSSTSRSPSPPVISPRHIHDQWHKTPHSLYPASALVAMH